MAEFRAPSRPGNARPRVRPLVALVLAATAGVATARAADGRDLGPWSGREKPGFVLDTLDHRRAGPGADPGHVVLVHFFATWCEPCRPEMAALQRLADRFAGRPLSILAVDVGEVDARVRRFFEKQPVTFPVLLDRDKAVTKAWQVSALPTTFVLDGTGAARLVSEGEVDWDGAAAERALEAVAIPGPASKSGYSQGSQGGHHDAQ